MDVLSRGWGRSERSQAIYKTRTPPKAVSTPARHLLALVAAGLLLGPGRRCRGRGWQVGQKYDERFMNDVRTIGVPQRAQGRPSCP
jgi:hypothetical protein